LIHPGTTPRHRRETRTVRGFYYVLPALVVTEAGDAPTLYTRQVRANGLGRLYPEHRAFSALDFAPLPALLFPATHRDRLRE